MHKVQVNPRDNCLLIMLAPLLEVRAYSLRWTGLPVLGWPRSLKLLFVAGWRDWAGKRKWVPLVFKSIRYGLYHSFLWGSLTADNKCNQETGQGQGRQQTVKHSRKKVWIPGKLLGSESRFNGYHSGHYRKNPEFVCFKHYKTWDCNVRIQHWRPHGQLGQRR